MAEEKKLTLKQKIDELLKKYDVSSDNDLSKDIFELFQHVLHPDQFCPECDDRMFLDNDVFTCPNCGFKSAPLIKVPTSAVASVVTRPSTSGVVPPQVDKMITDATEAMKDTPIPTPRGKKALGAKIQELVAKRDSGNAPGPTGEDEKMVRGDKNTSSKINWV